MYIAEVADHGVVGQARFSVSGEEAEIHVTVAPEHRGRGMGTALISASCRRLFSEQPGVRRILARALPGTVASIRAFQKAGFTPMAGRRSDTPEAICLVLPRGGGSQTGECGYEARDRQGRPERGSGGPAVEGMSIHDLTVKQIGRVPRTEGFMHQPHPWTGAELQCAGTGNALRGK